MIARACWRQLSFAGMAEAATLPNLRLHMESVAQPTASLRLPRYAGATLLTLISAGCLTLSNTHEGWFGRMLRIAMGLGLPWIVAWLVPAKP